MKGKKLGPRIPKIELEKLNSLLEDPAMSPEDRFEQAFFYATGVLARSTNAELQACMIRLEHFWRNDMARTIFVTPPEGYTVGLRREDDA